MTFCKNVFVPDPEIFDVAHIARQQQDHTNPCLTLFVKSWRHSIDSYPFLWITQELNNYLLDKKYKSQKKKRLALFSSLYIYDKFLGDDDDFSQIRLASILSLDKNYNVYFVTDNDQLRNLLSKDLKNVTFVNSVEANDIILGLE